MSVPDVLIVGAGLAGASLAWHLRRRAPGLRVELLDQAAQPASEASAQNAGMQRRLAHDPVERAFACRAATWLAAPPNEAFAAAIRRVGGVIALERDADWIHEAVADLRSRGVRVDANGPRPPALHGAELSGWWSVPDEAVLDGTLLTRALLDGLRPELGVRVHGLRQAGGRVVGLDTDQGPRDAGLVVLATGAWSASLARSHGLDRPLIPLARHLLQSAPHASSSPDQPWVWVDDVGVYARPEGGGWLCSPCDETALEPSPGPGSAGPVDPLVRALAHAKLATHLPALAEVRFARGWTGLRTFTPDRRPMLGADPALPGLIWATGLGGFGVTCAMAAGELIADLLEGRPTPWVDAQTVRPDRPFPDPLVPAALDLARYGDG